MNTSKRTRGMVIYLVEKIGNAEKIYLALKKPTPNAVKRKLAGKWNGYGGGVEPGDVSIEAAAARELMQEARVIGRPEDFEKVADIIFINSQEEYHCDFFLLRKYQDMPQETEEMGMPRPFPFEADALPLEAMMDSDKYILAPITDGKKLKGTIWHDKNMNVIKSEIKYVGHF